ncbi:glutamate racemase [Candidatus Nomurabacteria bacterium]|nr:glutamate racemase [Candidatus Nomurabacteria bacterium]
MAKIGIFDSGIGGLVVTKAITKALPKYDYVYLGDTQRVPYGPRSAKVVQDFTREAVKYLFEKENCGLIILACNTASARALRKMQKEFPSKKILGVLIPAAEDAAKFKKVGVIGTAGTVASNSFPREIKKINKYVKVFQNPAPMLVPLAEAGERKAAIPFIKQYLAPFLYKSRRPKGSGPRPNASGKIEALVLGCTHYPIFKREFELALRSLGVGGKIISQDEIIPEKLKDYLKRHPEIEKKLTRNKNVKILVTDKTKTIEKLTRDWFGKIKPKLISLS